MANLAFSQQGPTSGLLNPPKRSNILSGLTLPPQTQSVTNPLGGSSQPSTLQVGTNQGLLNQPKQQPTAPVSETVSADGTKTKYSTKSNPSVLEQQKNLNKLGAGLVEDGIVGPKTREAIAKYGNGTPTPPTAQITPTETPKPPVAIDPASSARGVLQGGQQTESEKQAMGNLQQSGQQTDLEKYYIDRVMKAQGMENVGKLGGYAEAGQRINQTPEQLYDALINAPDLVGRAGASKGLYDALTNIYGSQATQGLLAANTIAGRGLSAAQSGLSGAQTQAQRAQAGAGTVLEAGLPQQVPFGVAYRSPLTGEDITGGGGTSGLLKGSAAGLIPQYFNEYNQAQSVIDNISKNEQLFGNLLSTAKVNPTDLTPINEILQRVGQLTSSADYANFQNLVSSLRANYAQLLASRGLTPTDAGNTASSLIPDNASISTINSVLSTLKQEGQNYLSSKADQLKRAEETFKSGTAPDTSTPTTSSGGFGWDALN